MYTQIGSCPKCGAPIYTYTAWMAVTPPPNLYSCNCFANQTQRTYTTTSVGPMTVEIEMKAKYERTKKPLFNLLCPLCKGDYMTKVDIGLDDGTGPIEECCCDKGYVHSVGLWFRLWLGTKFNIWI